MPRVMPDARLNHYELLAVLVHYSRCNRLPESNKRLRKAFTTVSRRYLARDLSLNHFGTGSIAAEFAVALDSLGAMGTLTCGKTRGRLLVNRPALERYVRRCILQHCSLPQREALLKHGKAIAA